jgi:hypothetical protein
LTGELTGEAPEAVTDHGSNHRPGDASDDDEPEEQTQVRRSPSSSEDALARSDEDHGGPEGSTA